MSIKIGRNVKVFLNKNLGLFNVVTTEKPIKYITVEYITIKPTKFFVNLDMFNQKSGVNATGWIEGTVVDYANHITATEEINYRPKKYPYFFTTKNEKEYNSLKHKLNFKYDTLKVYIKYDKP